MLCTVTPMQLTAPVLCHIVSAQSIAQLKVNPAGTTSYTWLHHPRYTAAAHGTDLLHCCIE